MSERRLALLTGATGFLGRRILRQLIAENWIVRCTVRPSSDTASLIRYFGDEWNKVRDQVSFVCGQLSDPAYCDQVTESVDCVFHAAAALGGSTSSLILNTVVPTRVLLTAAAGRNVPRVVLVSSMGVYGPQKLRRNSVLDESCPVDGAPAQRDSYTYSKVLQEEVAQAVARERQLPLVIVRPGVIFGDERGVLSHRVGLPLGPILLRMGGNQQVPFTYVTNCAAAIVRAGQTPGIDGEVINIIDDELPTGRDVLRRYRRSGARLRTLGVPLWSINWLARFNSWYARKTQGQIPAVLTPHRVQAMWRPLRYSNERARRLLGWTPSVGLDEAFARTLKRTEALPVPGRQPG